MSKIEYTYPWKVLGDNLGGTLRQLGRYLETTYKVLGDNWRETWRQLKRYLETTGEVLEDNLRGTLRQLWKYLETSWQGCIVLKYSQILGDEKIMSN